MKTVNALVQECLALRARYDEEPRHSDHVAKLALEIFDGLRGWHRYNDRLRELLFAAAILHDIGWSQNAGRTRSSQVVGAAHPRVHVEEPRAE